MYWGFFGMFSFFFPFFLLRFSLRFLFFWGGGIGMRERGEGWGVRGG